MDIFLALKIEQDCTKLKVRSEMFKSIVWLERSLLTSGLIPTLSQPDHIPIFAFLLYERLTFLLFTAMYIFFPKCAEKFP